VVYNMSLAYFIQLFRTVCFMLADYFLADKVVDVPMKGNFMVCVNNCCLIVKSYTKSDEIVNVLQNS
jgi:hypothetical protein